MQTLITCPHCDCILDVWVDNPLAVFECSNCLRQFNYSDSQKPQTSKPQGTMPSNETATSKRQRLFDQGADGLKKLLAQSISESEADRLEDLFYKISEELWAIAETTTKAEKRLEKDSDRIEMARDEFGKGSDWGEFCKKPTKAQMEKVLEKLDGLNSKAMRHSGGQLCDCALELFPQLRK